MITEFARGSITVRFKFYRFGFNQTSKSVDNFCLTKQLNPISQTGGQMYSDPLPYGVSILCWKALHVHLKFYHYLSLGHGYFLLQSKDCILDARKLL